MRRRPEFVFVCVVLNLVVVCRAQDAAEESDESIAGHSYHGEAFNQGPRQRAYLMEGLGRANFPISTSSDEAQSFFNQGIDQLHGFWYFEAERSFRQVVALDPECAMAYWGLAMSNVNNVDRARDFIKQAGEKSKEKDRESTEREKLYISALAELYKDGIKEETKRAENFVTGLEKIVLAHPDDIEAKAFLVCQIWMNQRKKLPITSHVAVNSLLDQIFDVDPMHPAHHYRIHLWDYKDAEVALYSAANCGPALPDVAHMWHMPGHIYSKLKRYEDAVWQQEASARIDHRHMMHDQILPDQIHNFAHNNEWCVRNLNHVGRVRDAIDLATNMISMPRHPKYNHLDNRGSAWYGRHRLFETLSRYELWQELIDTCQTSALEPTDNELEQIKRLRYLGRAYYRLHMDTEGDQVFDDLEGRLVELKSKRDDVKQVASAKQSEKTQDYKQFANRLATVLPNPLASDFTAKLEGRIRRDHRKRMTDSVGKAVKDLDSQINVAKRAINELEGYQLIAEKKFSEAAKKLKQAGAVDAIYRASILARTKDEQDIEKAIKQAREFVDSHDNQVQPIANLAWLLWQVDRKEEASKSLETLRQLSSSLELRSPVFERLQVIAEHNEIDFEFDWQVTSTTAEDLGERPDLNSLGPFRWQPVEASEWELVDSTEQTVSMKQFQGKPVLIIFYLGHGCLHCAEQLQKFAPMLDQYRDAGIEMVAISSDQRQDLKNSIDSYGDQPLPIQLLADPKLDVFKSWRVYDEFENQPLHGTFLIDGDGKIRWQDISYEPFMDPEFLLKESTRLLSPNANSDANEDKRLKIEIKNSLPGSCAAT